jgi:hypothetical protein
MKGQASLRLTGSQLLHHFPNEELFITQLKNSFPFAEISILVPTEKAHYLFQYITGE